MKWLGIALLVIASCIVACKLGEYYAFRETATAGSSFGRFLSTPKTELLDDRKVRLLEDFVYIDPNETPWLAPQGSEVDGASIPRVFWTVMGAPFTGKYRNASIVHDVACDKMVKTPFEVHRMFFDACLAGGVPERDAQLLYYAVARYGPKWTFETETKEIVGAGPHEDPNTTRTVEVVVARPLESPVPTEEDLQKSKEFFSKYDLTPEEIEWYVKKQQNNE